MMSKRYLNDFCECTNRYLLYMGSYLQRGSHYQDEPYQVHCYYCSECGKELQIYTGYHNEETKKLYTESLKYSAIDRTSSFVIDVVKLNPAIFICSLDNKRNLIYNLINAKGIFSSEGQQVVLSYKNNK